MNRKSLLIRYIRSSRRIRLPTWCITLTMRDRGTAYSHTHAINMCISIQIRYENSKWNREFGCCSNESERKCGVRNRRQQNGPKLFAVWWDVRTRVRLHWNSLSRAAAVCLSPNENRFTHDIFASQMDGMSCWRIVRPSDKIFHAKLNDGCRRSRWMPPKHATCSKLRDSSFRNGGEKMDPVNLWSQLTFGGRCLRRTTHSTLFISFRSTLMSHRARYLVLIVHQKIV